MSDITNFNDQETILMKIYTWQVLIESVIRGFLSFSVFFIVLAVRKRKEFFLWMIPLQLAINNVLNTFLVAGALINGYADPDAYAEDHLVLLYVANATVVFAHWLFSAQYLQTSLILPKLFETSRLSFQLD